MADEQQDFEARSQLVLTITEDGEFVMGGQVRDEFDFYGMLEMAKEQHHHSKLAQLRRQAMQRQAEGGGGPELVRPNPDDIERADRSRQE